MPSNISAETNWELKNEEPQPCHCIMTWKTYREPLLQRFNTHFSWAQMQFSKRLWFARLNLSDHPLRGVSWSKLVLLSQLLILVMMAALSQAPGEDKKLQALLVKAWSWTSWAISDLKKCLRAVKAHLWTLSKSVSSVGGCASLLRGTRLAFSLL